jgi:hypothetical protein
VYVPSLVEKIIFCTTIKVIKLCYSIQDSMAALVIYTSNTQWNIQFFKCHEADLKCTEKYGRCNTLICKVHYGSFAVKTDCSHLFVIVSTLVYCGLILRFRNGHTSYCDIFSDTLLSYLHYAVYLYLFVMAI